MTPTELDALASLVASVPPNVGYLDGKPTPFPKLTQTLKMANALRNAAPGLIEAARGAERMRAVVEAARTALRGYPSGYDDDSLRQLRHALAALDRGSNG